MRLLKAYLKNKETDKAIALAQKIIQLQPKIPSEKVNQYKKMCLILLKNLEKMKINPGKRKQKSIKSNSI
jgi:hypothetical protein